MNATADALHGSARERGRRGPSLDSARTRRASAASAGTRESPDYRRWTIEELRAFAVQMQLPGAMQKSRNELIAIFDVSS